MLAEKLSNSLNSAKNERRVKKLMLRGTFVRLFCAQVFCHICGFKELDWNAKHWRVSVWVGR